MQALSHKKECPVCRSHVQSHRVLRCLDMHDDTSDEAASTARPVPLPPPTLAAPSPRELIRQARMEGRLPPSKKLNVGDRVQGKYQGLIGGRNWFDGVVRAVHEGGTCDLHNDDGDYEEQVAPLDETQLVKLLDTAAAAAAEPLSIYERYPHLAPPPERKLRAAVSAAAARERREPRAVAKAAIESGGGYRSIVLREADEAPSSSSRAIGEAAGAAAGKLSPSVSGVYQLSNRAKGSRLRLQKAQSPADT